MLANGDGRRAVLCALLWLYVAGAGAPAHAENSPPAQLSDVSLPGGLAGALVAIGDRLTPDRATFVVDLIERFYNTPKPPRQNQFPQLQALLTRLDTAVLRHDADSSRDLLPLPLTGRWWSDVVFRRSIPDESLLVDILQDRQTAYLYWGLLALDAPTRTWIAGEPSLVGHIVRGRAARFVVASPAMRVRDGRVRVPGGDRAIPAWEALVGSTVQDPAAFFGKLLDSDQGWSAHVFRSLGALSEEQIACALRLDGETARRVEALQRLSRAFIRTGESLDIDSRPFSRPWRDPALLLGDLDTDGRNLRLPFDEPLWTRVFEARGDPSRLRPAHQVGAHAPPDPVWLIEQVFDADVAAIRLRADQVMFAARTFGSLADGAETDAAVAVTALGHFPAVVRALERLRVTDPAVYRAAVDRAAALDRIPDTAAKTRAVAQFQGAFALVIRGAARRSIDAALVPELVTSLASVDPNDAGAYEGRVATWINEHLRPLARARRSDGRVPAAAASDDAESLERDILRLLAGPTPFPAQIVQWEGTSYRIDLAAAEAARLDAVRGEQPPPWLSSAWQVLGIAGQFAGQQVVPPAVLAGAAARVTRIADDLGLRAALVENGPAGRLVSEVLRAFNEAGANRPAANQRLGTSLRRLADDLTATGLVELAYAAALGASGGSPIGAGEAASRHDFGFDRDEGAAPVAWRLPVPSVHTRGPWHLEGSLLALDVCLADRWMTRVSAAPLPSAPSIDKVDRRSLMEVTTLVEPARLDDATRDTIAGQIRAGRARLARATEGDIDAIRGLVPLGAVRAGLLPWVVSHERERLARFLSTTELLWLGLGAADAGASLDAWGAAVRPRIGCLCLQFPRRRAPDAFAGRLSSGILMGAVPDLNLRLAELLADLRMPAVLLPSVLAAATPDVVDRAAFRYPDDLRALDERVQALTVDDVEQYLALLTTGGPLVPATGALENSVVRGRPSALLAGDPFRVFAGRHPSAFVSSRKSTMP